MPPPAHQMKRLLVEQTIAWPQHATPFDQIVQLSPELATKARSTCQAVLAGKKKDLASDRFPKNQALKALSQGGHVQDSGRNRRTLDEPCLPSGRSRKVSAAR